ncbi:MAG TPA: hypothetical protein PLI53_01170 [Geobacteraceae bacterium]|nr:hypothetical protein [Geobacteraceae bacterium]
MAFESLSELFKVSTFNGNDMSGYDFLLQRAVRSIKHIFRKRNISGLLSGRAANRCAS